jgi:hypothetical protein
MRTFTGFIEDAERRRQVAEDCRSHRHMAKNHRSDVGASPSDDDVGPSGA